MTKNPILDELRETRERLLAEAGGTIEGLVAKLQQDERHSGREMVQPKNRTSLSSDQLLAPQLSSDEVLRVACLDAEHVYRDLARFVIRIAREPDGWHVDFDLQDAAARGGGPHYVIDPETGVIVTKRYEQ